MRWKRVRAHILDGPCFTHGKFLVGESLIHCWFLIFLIINMSIQRYLAQRHLWKFGYREILKIFLGWWLHVNWLRQLQERAFSHFHERTIQNIIERRSFEGIGYQNTFDQFGCFDGDLRLFGKLVVTRAYLVVDFWCMFTLKWWKAIEKRIDNNPYCPNINLKIVSGPF